MSSLSPPVVRACVRHWCTCVERMPPFCLIMHASVYPATSLYHRGAAGIPSAGVFFVHYCSSDPSFHLRLPPPNITRGFSPRFTLKSDTKSKSSNSWPPLSFLFVVAETMKVSAWFTCWSVMWAGSTARLKLLNAAKPLSLTTAYIAEVCLLSAALEPSQLKGCGMDSQSALSDHHIHCTSLTASHNTDVHV